MRYATVFARLDNWVEEAPTNVQGCGSSPEEEVGATRGNAQQHSNDGSYTPAAIVRDMPRLTFRAHVVLSTQFLLPLESTLARLHYVGLTVLPF